MQPCQSRRMAARNCLTVSQYVQLLTCQKRQHKGLQEHWGAEFGEKAPQLAPRVLGLRQLVLHLLHLPLRQHLPVSAQPGNWAPARAAGSALHGGAYAPSFPPMAAPLKGARSCGGLLTNISRQCGHAGWYTQGSHVYSVSAATRGINKRVGEHASATTAHHVVQAAGKISVL